MAGIISVAKSLGIWVIAEGIETPAQRQLCRNLGTDFMQRFLFARPANPPQKVQIDADNVNLLLAA